MRSTLRRGSFGALYAITGTVLIGFASIGLDVAMIRLGQLEAQDIADAASQSAILNLRSSGDEVRSADLTDQLVENNRVMGNTPALRTLQYGTWADGAFTPNGTPTNAARAVVGAPVELALSTIFGQTETDVERSSISATRALHVVLVVDITNSWSQSNFANARLASVAFFDQIASAAGPDDKIGMVVFTGQYGVEHTPLQLVSDAVANGVRDDWNALRTASKAGRQQSNGNCSVHGGAKLNDFNDPVNGCYPSMWREYSDESGTDHAAGIDMARQMFVEDPDPTVYRAMLLLTDGEPNGTGGHVLRGLSGFQETRWRSARTLIRRTTTQVRSDSISASDALWNDLEVNTWAVSFVANATWLADVAHGDGYYYKTSSSSALSHIFVDVAESLPVAVVQ